MSDLHDARVEEIAKVMADMNGEPRPGRYERTLATVALKNADAAVTVEMIAEVIGKSRTTSIRGDDGYKSVVMESNETIARAVLTILRGDEEQ